MKWFKTKKVEEEPVQKVEETRNMAVAQVLYNATPSPLFTNWTIENAVKFGYRCNSSVYRAVFLKAKAGSSVPWFVVNADGEKVEKHHLTKLFSRPNPFVSRQDMFELIISWLELAGNSYLKKVITRQKTVELWPVSPDRLHPIPTNRIDEWCAGYALDTARTASFPVEEIIHHKYFNPANPLLGIAPLEAAAKTVDIDNGQKDFNKSTTQNRGVIDGVFTFERPFTSQAESDAIAEKLNEKHKGKRAFAVLGSNAKYTRTALSPAEMDFLGSSKFNREEIFIVFGVPPVYAGITDAATMNNYKTSELVFWFGTMLFLLDDLADTFTFSFHNELAEGEKITYDITGVPAIREAMLEKAKTARELHSMGVPFSQLNKVFAFGFDEFEDWDKSNVKQPVESAPDVRNRPVFTLAEYRASDHDLKVDKAVEIRSKAIYGVLQTMQEAVFDAIDEGRELELDKVIKGQRQLLLVEIVKLYQEESVSFGQGMVIEQRSAESALSQEVRDYLASEGTVLTEISFIEASTVSSIIDHVTNALLQGMSTAELQQSIIDSGIFDEKRALSLARTLVGTASNLGQLKGAELGGAKIKTWMTAGFEVRESHQAMEGVTVDIDEYFNVNGELALYP